MGSELDSSRGVGWKSDGKEEELSASVVPESVFAWKMEDLTFQASETEIDVSILRRKGEDWRKERARSERRKVELTFPLPPTFEQIQQE